MTEEELKLLLLGGFGPGTGGMSAVGGPSPITKPVEAMPFTPGPAVARQYQPRPMLLDPNALAGVNVSPANATPAAPAAPVPKTDALLPPSNNPLLRAYDAQSAVSTNNSPLPAGPLPSGGMNPDLGMAPAPAMPSTPAQAPAGGFLSRLQAGLPDDFRDRLTDAMLGFAMGRNPNEGIASAAAMMGEGIKARRGEKKSAEETNKTRQAALAMGIPAEVANSLDGRSLMGLIAQVQQQRLAGSGTKPNLSVQSIYDGQGREQKVVMDMNTGTVVSNVGGAKTGERGSDFDNEQKLRKEYTAAPEYKRFDEVSTAYERIRTGASQDSGAGDLGVVYGYMKMLDPGSVVREGEFATAQNSAGVPEYIRSLYNQMINGERLTPQQRQQFVGAAEGLYNDQATAINEYNTRFTDIATDWGLDPKRILRMPKTYEPWKPPTKPDETKPGPVSSGNAGGVQWRIVQ